MSKPIENLTLGQTARLQRSFTEEDVRLCNRLTKDSSPIYQPDEDGWKGFYSRPVVPGLLTEGLVTQVISEKLPGRTCLLLQKELVFYHPVHVGDEITAELEVIHINEERNWVTEKVVCCNQKGIEVIKGQVVLLLLSHHN